MAYSTKPYRHVHSILFREIVLTFFYNNLYVGIVLFHKINGWYSFSNVFVVSKILQGCRRLRPVVDKRAPIALSMLQQICAVVPVVSNSIFESMLFKAFSVAYFGLFRVSELVFTNNGNRSISVVDIRFDSDQKHVVLCHRTSKTNQIGK